MAGKKVLLRVSPMMGIMWFRKKDKLSSRFIGLFEILERVGEVAYRLAFPPSLVGVHRVFHVSMLRRYHKNRSHVLDFSIRRYHKDRSHVLDFSTVHLDENLTYEKESVAILNWQVRKLRSMNFPSVKVHWRDHPIEEATWESESDMRSRYPHLFTNPGPAIAKT
ncbi:PREDICTED: uncharacterized protein LOC109241228 [Nicotiana attenuata]|uniref:uncharacterized protein LOC109241228 n=1 Tax=Nicotiana attenuata TaxID=49451 RepID=UPI0009047FDB|nr:PREDICTED: uncharacterized protein LOC109241228 [Nicotiana attenuata]